MTIAITDKIRSALIKRSTDACIAFAQDNGFSWPSGELIAEEDNPRGLSDKALTIQEFLQHGPDDDGDPGQPFGCRTGSVCKLMSLVLGEDIQVSDEDSADSWKWRTPNGAVVVCLRNPNSHDYVLGEPVLVTNDRIAMMPNGREGNNLPTELHSIRLATPEEIDVFYSCYKRCRAAIRQSRIIFLEEETA